MKLKQCNFCIELFIRASISLLIITFLTDGDLIGQSTINYYVSPSGSNSNPGTSAAPFKTVQHCINQWDGVSQFICNCSGTFNEELEIEMSGPSPIKRNKLIAWDTDNDGQLNDETFILDGQNTRNIGLTNKQRNPFSKPDNIEVAYMHFMNFFPNGGCHEDSLANFIDLQCPKGSGCNDWWIHHCQFENIGYKSPSEHCFAGSHVIAIKPTNAARLVIEENSFKNIYAFLMRYIDGPDIKFKNNYVEIATTGIKGWGYNLDRLEISGNTFACDGNGNDDNTEVCQTQHAINISNNARDALIKNNVFYDCISCIHFGTEEFYGVRSNTGHLIENNVIHASEKVCNKFTAPISIDDCTELSTNPDSVGQRLWVSDITFRNNIINYAGVHTVSSQWNQGPAIDLQSGHPWGEFSNNVHIYNNTIKGFYWGIRFTQCRLGSSPTTYYPTYQFNTLSIQNNIFTDIRDAQYSVSTNGTWVGGALPSNISSDYNTFYGRDRFKWLTNKTLANWKALGYDLNSAFCEPSFVDTIQLRLAPNDVCAKDKGFPVSGFMNDIDNDPRPTGVNWDIGADEFVINSSFKVVAKAVLGGAYFPAGDTMSTSLRSQNFISSKCPYDTTITLAAVATNMVDWVKLDLVDTLTGDTTYSSQCACLLNNGLIQNVSGDTMVTFSLPPRPFYSLRLKHRNHLSVRSMGLPSVSGGLVAFDFRAGNNLYVDPTITGTAYHNVGLPEVLITSGGSHPSRYALWPGDSNADGQVKYQGSGNDRGMILSAIGGTTITNTVSGYLPSDINLNGQVKYQGSSNDRGVVLSSIGGLVITKVTKAHN